MRLMSCLKDKRLQIEKRILKIEDRILTLHQDISNVSSQINSCSSNWRREFNDNENEMEASWRKANASYLHDCHQRSHVSHDCPIDSKHSLFRSTYTGQFTDEEYETLFEEDRHNWIEAGYKVAPSITLTNNVVKLKKTKGSAIDINNHIEFPHLS